MKRATKRRALTLLELVTATALLATLVTAVAVLLRGAHAAWQGHDKDLARLEAAHATLRHLVRNIRQAQAVSAVSPAGDLSGALSIVMPSGQTYAWDHDDVAERVNFGITTASDLLAEEISELNFVGYRADGTTSTTAVEEIQSIDCQVTVELPRQAGGTRTVITRAWLRSW
ncbi:MAG: hypothetical protein WD403_05150 [Pirellulales bacterium]